MFAHRRSSERLRYAVDVANKCVNDAFKVFSNGKKPYQQLFTDVCQDLTAQLDTLNLLIKPLQVLAPKFDFEDVEGNGFRSLLNVVDCALKEMIVHVKMCIAKHNSFFFSGTAAATKLQSFCLLLAKLAKMLDIATMMGQQLKPGSLFLELNNPVGNLCIQELEGLQREVFYGALVGFQYPANIQRLMKAICVVQTSYGLGYYADLPQLMGAPSDGKNFIWRSSTSIVGGAKYWFKDDERAEKFVQLTHKCASTEFTKSFWSLIETGVMAEVPKLVNKKLDVAIEIFITGVPLYVRNKSDEMLLIHPPFSSKGATGVTVGFLSARFREGQEKLNISQEKIHKTQQKRNESQEKLFKPHEKLHKSQKKTHRHNSQINNLLPLVSPQASSTEPTQPIKRWPKCNRLLVHFHGGGFVAGSHTAHETYLRHWCAELDTVVVSVNYSLAPENPFPRGLDDCTFAYAWCLENLHSLGCTGKSIVFMGDSAGGNLAITTALRANSYGLRGPDAILSVYPVTYVKYAGSPSRLLSAMDVLLPTGVMQCCVRAYAGVPVGNNRMFYEWLQTAENTMSGEEKREERLLEQEVENGFVEITVQENTEEMRDESEEERKEEKVHAMLKRLNNNAVHDHRGEEEEEEEELDLVNIRPEFTLEEEDEADEDDVIEVENNLNRNDVNSVTNSDVEIEDELNQAYTPANLNNGLGNVEAGETQEVDETTEEGITNDNLEVNVEAECKVSDDAIEESSTAERSEIEIGKVESTESETNSDAEIEDALNAKASEVGNELESESVLDVVNEEAEVESVPMESEEDMVTEDEAKVDIEEVSVCLDLIAEGELNHAEEGILNHDESQGEVGDISAPTASPVWETTEEEVTERESPVEGLEERESPVEGLEERESPVEGLEERESPVEGLEERESPAEGLEERESPAEGLEERESPLEGLEERESPLEGLEETKPDRTADLEEMLLEEEATPFHGTKLVLSPDKTTTPSKPRPTPLSPAQPPSPTKSNVYMEPSPLGIMATVVEDRDLFPEPAYIINPGEIATRKNITLLQKYFDDPFMSPYLATEEMLQGLPPVYIIAAELDPLLDDSVSFCHKLKNAGGKVKLKVVPGMTHGFLNLTLSSQLCADASNGCLRTLQDMFMEIEN